MLEHQPPVAGAQGAGGQDVLLPLETVELHAHPGRHANPPRGHKGEEQGWHHAHLIGQVQLEQRCHHNEGHAVDYVGNALHHQVHRAAVVALDGAVDSTDEQVDGGNADGQEEAEPGAGRQAGEDILALGVGAEHEGRLKAVAVLEIRVLAHAHHIAGRGGGAAHPGIGQGTFRVVIRGDAQGMVGGIRGGGGLVDGLEVAFVVQGRHALAVGLIPDVGIALPGIGNGGIDHLDARLVLPGLDGLKLVGGQGQVRHAHAVVVVHLQVVEGGLAAGGGIGIRGPVYLQHGVQPGLLGQGAHGVVVRLVDGNIAGAVHAQPAHALHLGGQLGVHQVGGIGKGAGIGGLAEDRHKDGVEHQEQDDIGRHHGALVFAKADHGVLKIAHRLGFQLFVMEPALVPHKGELGRGNLRKVFHLTHHFLLPILILGSIRP